MDLAAMGRAGMSGWQEKVGERLARPVADKTGVEEDRVIAIIGALFLALSIYQFVVLMRKVVRAGRVVAD